MGAKLTYSMLDLFILSVLDRGLETPYDLNRQGDFLWVRRCRR